MFARIIVAPPSSFRVVSGTVLMLLLALNLSAGVAEIALLPLSFEANDGQTDSRFRFLARGSGYRLFFAPGEIVMAASAGGRSADVVRMRFAGASDSVRLTASEPQPGRSNYFIGNDPAKWHRDVANYAKVRYQGLYPGIDFVYYGNGRQLEYDIIVSPGADPGQVVLVFDGVAALSIAADGNLAIDTVGGSLVQRKPVVYQNDGTRREPVSGRYVLLGEQRVGFAIGGYDGSRPLIIDPVLVYSTYLGGGGNDVGRAIAIDTAGNMYLTGETESLQFPGASTSPIQAAQSGAGYDAFVAKLNAAGTALVYSTYLGGSNHDYGYAIAVDAAGNAYVTGQTSSPTVAGTGNTPFPTVGPFQASYGLGGDAFVTKINAAGNALVYSSYFGGTGTERGDGIAVDSSGSVYVSGHTNSTNMPVVAAFQPLTGGSYDAFVAQINAAGSALVYSTYLGGTGSEYSTERGGLAIDTAGNVYLAGTTSSTNFPGAGASTIQPIYGGDFNDGYVAKLSATGGVLLYSTFLGGSGREEVYGLAIDAANNVYVAGVTDSLDFPTSSPLQPARAGTTGNDAFVTKINAAGSALVYSTYLGGTGGDIAFALAVDGSGVAYVTGSTDSLDFPTAAALQPAKGGAHDMFLSAVSANGSALLYSTYFGGAGAEQAHGVAVDGAGNARVTGSTNSANFPTAEPLQPMLGGTLDVFIITVAGPGPAAPAGLIATATSVTQIDLTWDASPGAVYYEVIRLSAEGSDMGVTPETSAIDASVTPGKTYVYAVRALDSLGQRSPFSNLDAATTILFSNDPLAAGVTVIQAVHVQQLRQATNAMRATAGLSTVFTDPILNGLEIRTSHVADIRLQLAEARSTLGLATMTFSDALEAGTTIVKAIHLQQLRTAVK